jgi:hypothetical protein
VIFNVGLTPLADAIWAKPVRLAVHKKLKAKWILQDLLTVFTSEGCEMTPSFGQGSRKLNGRRLLCKENLSSQVSHCKHEIYSGGFSVEKGLCYRTDW